MWALLLLRAHPKPQHRQRVEFPRPSEGTSAEDSCSSLLTHPVRPIDGMLRCHVCPQIATARHGPGRMGQCWVGSAGSRLEVSLGQEKSTGQSGLCRADMATAAGSGQGQCCRAMCVASLEDVCQLCACPGGITAGLRAGEWGSRGPSVAPHALPVSMCLRRGSLKERRIWCQAGGVCLGAGSAV